MKRTGRAGFGNGNRRLCHFGGPKSAVVVWRWISSIHACLSIGVFSLILQYAHRKDYLDYRSVCRADGLNTLVAELRMGIHALLAAPPGLIGRRHQCDSSGGLACKQRVDGWINYVDVMRGPAR